MHQIIDEVQNKIVTLLRESKGNAERPLSELCADSCSELSRLSAYWLSKKLIDSQFTILKGVGVGNGQDHDVLVISSNKNQYLIDATIWQFFPEKETIFLGEFVDLEKTLHFLKDMYGGDWSVSEQLTEASFKEKDEWIRIVRENSMLG